MNKKLFLMLLVAFSVFLIPAVTAEKVEIEQNNGLLISTPNQEYIEAGEHYRFNFHLSRLNDGTSVNDNDTICRFTLYDNQGEILLNTQADYNTDLTNNWHVNVSGGNLTRVGEYNYYISCTDNLNKLGGIRSKQFWITDTGDESFDQTYAIILLVISFGAAFTGFFGRNIWVSVLGGILMIFVGIFLITNGIVGFNNQLTEIISIITISFGFLFTMYPLVEWIQDLL